MSDELLIANIGLLATPDPATLPARGDDLGALVQVARAAIAVRDGVIVAAGAEADVRASAKLGADARVHDAGGALAVPGFVDCHTHAVFAGDRANEFELRNRGADYEQIHAAGGGIRSTMQRTREALADHSVVANVRRHYDWMLAAGTTTAEVKSGYALTLDGELAMLEAAREVARTHALDVATTVLAAHTVPPEYGGDADAYLDAEAIPAVVAAAAAHAATAADVFLERGSFDRAQARRYLEAARTAGLALRLHSDQFSDQGGIELAIELGARSVDHLEALEPGAPRLHTLAQSDVAGVLLPLSSLLLRRPFAPGRALVDAGAIVALASDFNPGSSYGESLTLAMSLACAGCGLGAAEALTACTANAAWVLGLHERVGCIAPGYAADVVLFDQPDVVHLAYHVGTPRLRCVVKAGHVIGTDR